MDVSGELSAVGVLAERLDVLRALDDAPREKPALVDELDYSRSTVDRAIRSLEAAGYVTFVDGGHTLTVTGTLALERYEALVAETETALEAAPVLDALPPGLELPPSVLTDAEVAVGDADRIVDRLSAALSTGDRCRVILPETAGPQYLQSIRTLCHDRGLDATVVADGRTLDRISENRPRLAIGLLDSDRLSVSQGDVPEYGLGLAASDGGDPERAMLLAVDDTGPRGCLCSSDSTTLTWARGVVRDALTDAADASARLLTGEETASRAGRTDARLPVTLRSEGFDRIDEQFFENRTSVDPTTAWRAGLKLPEVAAGYAVERSRNRGDGRESVADRMLSDLDTGEDVALLGRPGSGKSTVCKQVAYRWFDGRRGPVLYRESGQGQPFESLGSLEQFLERADGHALVVVEDAVRAEANRVFEAMQAFNGREDVTFLLDAREGEWREPDDLPVDARLESFRQEDVETVHMPPLDDHERRAVIERFRRVVDAPLPESDDRLLGIGDVPDSETEPDAGSVFLLFHRLARYAEPLADGRGGLTTLDEHVETVRQRLAEAGDAVLDVGVLVNALNAAGIGVYPGYLYALAAAGEVDETTVREAIELLEGEILFESDGDGPFRTVHDAWSVEFLDQLLAAEGEAVARRRFGRGLTAVLGLADEPERQQEIAGGDNLQERIEADPAEWTDDIARQLFDFAESYPRLSSLFGTIDDESFELPDASSGEVNFYGCLKRGRGYYYASLPQTARTEFQHIIDSLPDPRTATSVSESRGRLYARALSGLCNVAHTRENTRAIEYGREAIEAFQTVGDDRGIVVTRVTLGTWLGITGDNEAAYSHLRRALEIAKEIEDDELLSYCRFGIGQFRGRTGDVDDAINELHRSLRLARQANSQWAMLMPAGELTHFNRSQGNLATAEQYGRQWLEVAEDIGDTSDQVTAHLSLALCKIDRGQLDDARRHLEQGEALEDGSNVDIRANLRWARGSLARMSDNHDVAREHLTSAIELSEQNDLVRSAGIAHLHLGWTLLEKDEIGTAAEHADTAVEMGREIESPQITGYARVVRGLIALETDDLGAAEEHFETAIDRCDPDVPSTAAMARHGLGHLARKRDKPATARERYDSALETFRETERIYFALDVVEDLADLTGDIEHWYGVGAEMAEDADLPERASAFRERASSDR